MKKSDFCMRLYERSIPFVIGLTSFWNFVLLYISTLKTSGNGISMVSMIFVIYLIATGAIWICLVFFLRFLPWIEHCIIFRNKIKSDESRIKKLVKIINKLKDMKAGHNNFKADEDQCCICLEIMKADHEIVFLPCHTNHCMHYDCIARWMFRDSRCPICKQDVTLEAILDHNSLTCTSEADEENQLVNNSL